MLDHITFRNFSTEQPQEEFLRDITTGKWTILYMGGTTGIGSFTVCLDLDSAAYAHPPNEQPNELRFYFGQVFPNPSNSRYIGNRSQFILRLANVLEISTINSSYTGYILRYRNGDAILLAHSPIYESERSVD